MSTTTGFDLHREFGGALDAHLQPDDEDDDERCECAPGDPCAMHEPDWDTIRQDREEAERNWRPEHDRGLDRPG